MSSTLAEATAERDGGAAPYQRHRPERTLLYQIVEQHYPAFVAHMAQQERPLPDYVQREFEDYLMVRMPPKIAFACGPFPSSGGWDSGRHRIEGGFTAA